VAPTRKPFIKTVKNFKVPGYKTNSSSILYMFYVFDDVSIEIVLKNIH
jgi:hypothetical protein